MCVASIMRLLNSILDIEIQISCIRSFIWIWSSGVELYNTVTDSHISLYCSYLC